MANGTARGMSPHIGARVQMRTDTDLVFDVEVIDVRTRWGNLDFKVVPVAGLGECWVSALRCTRDGKPIDD